MRAGPLPPPEKGDAMRYQIRVQILMVGVAVLLAASSVPMTAESSRDLSAEWWQWALSIPASENPLVDTDGSKCMVGQRGSTWFLAGVFFGGTAVRNCTIPPETDLFFPVYNSVQIDTPGLCGQGPSIPVVGLRATAANDVAGVTNLLAEVDGRRQNLRHVRSRVFAVALPVHHLFEALCGAGEVPDGVYAPAVDEGFYANVNELDPGMHSVHIHADNNSANVHIDV